MNKQSAFCERLKAKRLHAKLSQLQLANMSGFTQASISQMEKGQRLPTPEMVAKFASILSVSENELTGESIDYEYNRLMRNAKHLSQERLKQLNDLIDLFHQADHGKKKQ